MTDAGGAAAVSRALSALQSRDSDAAWTELTSLIQTDWKGADNLIVACFYVATHREWPSGPTRNQLKGFVEFLAERYEVIVTVPPYVTEEIIDSVFTGDYRIFGYVPHDTLLILQLLVTSAITAHRGISADKLRSFVDGIAREATRGASRAS